MGSPKSLSALVDLFPALRKVGSDCRARQIPFVQQMQATDCGAATLAMVLGFHGKWVPLDEVRQVVGAGRDGTDALAILKAAHWYGLRGRGIKVDIDDLKHLGRGSILHWDFTHFVVFDGLGKDGADIVDPALGRRHVPIEQFRRSFTGVAITLEPNDLFQTAPDESKRLWSYWRQVLGQSALLTRVMITSLLIQVIALSLPVFTGVLIDRVVPRGDYHLLVVLCGGLVVFVLSHFLASLLRGHLLLHLRGLIDARMTLGFVDYLVELPYSFFQRRSTGDLMLRVNSNSTIRELLTSSVVSGLLDGALVSVYFFILMALSVSMGALILGLALLQIGIFFLLRPRYRDLTSQQLQTQARSQSYLTQMLAGVETLKASGAEHRAVEHWSNLFVEEMNISLSRGRLSVLFESLMSSLRIASPLIILAFGGFKVLRGELSLGTMLGLSALAGGLLAPLSTLVSSALQLQLVGSYVQRINDVLGTTPEQDRNKVTRIGKLQGRITLEHISFRYVPLAPMVVQDVSTEIKPGQFVAVVGQSGAGKSTLAKLLLGLYPPTEGRILYDEICLAELDSHSVRNQLGIVAQYPFLFGTSIRTNIAMIDPALPLDAVVKAAKLAHIHDDIVAMPMGYDTLLVDNGASLSGGQRQRVALARALVHKPAILLLDEATNSLDVITERKIYSTLASLQCTRIVIAQRLSTVINADLILVMEKGQIVEQGKHKELMALRGKYFELVLAKQAVPRTAVIPAVPQVLRTN